MATKDDPPLNRVFDKFFPLLYDLEALRKELPQSSLEDIQYFLDTFDEWDQHPTAKRMFEVEAAFREPSSVSDREIIKRYMERVRECSLETFRLLAEHEETEVLGTALRVFPWKGYEEQKQVLQEVLKSRGIGTTDESRRGGLDKGAVQSSWGQSWGTRMSPMGTPMSDFDPVEDGAVAGVEPLAEEWTSRPRREESVGRTIITHRQEILETGPGIKATIDEILVWYDENPPNDPDTQKFVEQLGTLSTGLDTYLAMLQAEPTETEAEAVGRSLFEKALSTIKAFEETYTGNKIIRVSTCVAILGIAGIAAPMLAPWITVPLMGAYVFPEETKVATGLFTTLKDIAKKCGLITSPAYVVIKAADQFEHKTTRPNQLWQTDFTYMKVIGWGWFYLSTILDDYSRYIVAWRLCTSMKAEDVTETLDRALQASGCDQVKVYHKPRLLSDNGSSYISGDLADWLRAQGMEHIRGAPYHPQTQGKIERWHQTLKNRILLENYYLPGDLEAQVEAFVEHYNHHRYHESLSNLTPADVYFGRGQTILLERERIKRKTIETRRLDHRKSAA